jgi:hypothetical protein
MFDKFVMGDPSMSKDIWPSAIALEAGAAVVRTWAILESCVVEKFGVFITVALNYDTMTANCVLKLKKRPIPGSASGEVVLATITLLQGWAALTSYFVKVDNALNAAKCKRGEELVAEITTQGAGGTEVGDFQPYWCGHPTDESAGNLGVYQVDITPA